jgi:hypothetical protein
VQREKFHNAIDRAYRTLILSSPAPEMTKRFADFDPDATTSIVNVSHHASDVNGWNLPY